LTHYSRTMRIAAPAAALYELLATEAGLRSWWTQTCDAGAAVGEQATFRFGRTHKTMEIERLEPGREVSWRCVQAHLEAPGVTRPDEWVGTRIVFRLEPQDARTTRLYFEHVGLLPSLQCFEVCRGGWDQYLWSLRARAESGHGTPYAEGAQCSPVSNKRQLQEHA
jgi:uncharacterized protein YndB with AHSA1/START domain